MSSKPPVAVLDAPATDGRLISASTLISDYWALTKPEVNFLILITTFAGFYLACANAGREFSFLALSNTLVGTLLVASGTATLNQYIERTFDAQMRRTSRRPLAAGRLEPSAVLAFGIGLSAAGTVWLALAAGALASLLALLTLLSYLFLYTPLKRRTPLCVLVGAFPGAMPPLIGWAAASGRLNAEAWLLFCLVLLWQFPHFMAIAWMYREDYDRAGYFVLPRDRSRDRIVITQTILPLLLLVLVTLLPMPTPWRESGLLYQLGALVLSLSFLYCGIRFVLDRSGATARRLLVASIFYLPLLLVLTIAA